MISTSAWHRKIFHITHKSFLHVFSDSAPATNQKELHRRFTQQHLILMKTLCKLKLDKHSYANQPSATTSLNQYCSTFEKQFYRYNYSAQLNVIRNFYLLSFVGSGHHKNSVMLRMK